MRAIATAPKGYATKSTGVDYNVIRLLSSAAKCSKVAERTEHALIAPTFFARLSLYDFLSGELTALAFAGIWCYSMSERWSTESVVTNETPVRDGMGVMGKSRA